jgi:hypothetical protein
MSPLRWDVLLVGFVLALPVLALGLRGDLSTEEMMMRVLWCLGAGWAVVAVLRLASTPRPSAPATKGARRPADDPAGSQEPFPAL